MNQDEYNDIMNIKKRFIFDTNIYLELYRLSTTACNDIMEILEKIKDDVCIPYQVYKEYTNRSQEVKNKQYNVYKNARINMIYNLEKYSSSQKKFLKECCRLKYPELEQLERYYANFESELKEKINGYFEEIKDEIKSKKEYLDNDKVKQFVELLFNSGGVWEETSVKELLEIIREGEIRFKYKIPPGYMDSQKKDVSKFGDLIIWKEILRHINRDNENIIFVTNDVKEDWWEDPETQIARHELLNEFQEVDNNSNIIFLTLPTFVELTSHYLEVDAYFTSLELQLNQQVEELISKEDEERIDEQIHEFIDRYYEELQDNDAKEEHRYISKSYKKPERYFEKVSQQNVIFTIEKDYNVYSDESYEGIEECGVFAERRFEVKVKIEIQFDIDVENRKSEKRLARISLYDSIVEYKSPGEVYEDMVSDALAEEMDALEQYYMH